MSLYTYTHTQTHKCAYTDTHLYEHTCAHMHVFLIKEINPQSIIVNKSLQVSLGSFRHFVVFSHRVSEYSGCISETLSQSDGPASSAPVFSHHLLGSQFPGGIV